MKEGVLRKCLWGDFYLDPKTKRVIGYKGLKGRALKPLAIHLVLDNVWKVYDVVVVNPYVALCLLLLLFSGLDNY